MASLLIRASGRIAWVLIALMIAAAGARAEQPYSFAATPGKLPKTVVPVHYAIDLKPDLEKLTLTGSELGADGAKLGLKSGKGCQRFAERFILNRIQLS